MGPSPLPVDDSGTRSSPPVVIRTAWIVVGLCSAAVGGIAIAIPGLPTTVFFVFAAWCFSKSSPRLEAWLLGLPGIGILVTNYRAGLGMPVQAKVTANLMITAAVVVSAFIVDKTWVAVAILATGLVGVLWVTFKVPTHRPDHIAETDTSEAVG